MFKKDVQIKGQLYKIPFLTGLEIALFSKLKHFKCIACVKIRLVVGCVL